MIYMESEPVDHMQVKGCLTTPPCALIYMKNFSSYNLKMQKFKNFHPTETQQSKPLKQAQQFSFNCVVVILKLNLHSKRHTFQSKPHIQLIPGREYMWYVSCAKLCESGADTLYTDILYNKIYDCLSKSVQKLRRSSSENNIKGYTHCQTVLQPVFQMCETIHATSNLCF